MSNQKLSQAQMRKLRELADDMETTATSAWHEMGRMGYKGSKKGPDQFFEQRRAHFKACSEDGPMALAMLRIQDSTTDLVADINETAMQLDLPGPREVREVVEKVQRLQQAMQNPGPEASILEGRLQDAIETLQEAGADVSELQASYSELFPPRPEDTDDAPVQP